MLKIKNELLRGIVRLVVLWLFSCIIMILGKAVFFAVYHDIINPDYGSFAAFLDIVIHGFRMDSTVAAYISLLPALLISWSLVVRSNITDWIEKIYYMMISCLLGAIFVVDAILYSYWGFRLDMTPIFYFTSSPAAAMASMTALQITGGIVLWIFVSASIWFIYVFARRIVPWPIPVIRGGGRFYPLWMLLFSTLLIIPLRGGLTVSTTNLSSAYFSQNARLNHAAVNPAFSLLYSLTHQTDFQSQFRYMPEEKANKLMKEMVDPSDMQINDSTLMLADKRPDIYIIILESFSSHLFPSLGGERVAVHLDSIAANNVLFTNFYASGFRTDRAIPAILSGFPAQPNTSVMKYVDKASKLPNIARSLAKAGYESEYFYGGDADFTNMQAYLMNGGFSRVVSDKDFPISKKMSKWGAHDDVLFAKVKEEISGKNGGGHHLRVIQTSSSHEPFEVPYENPAFAGSAKKNAFAFTDSCAADFIKYLERRPDWKNTLVVVVPDHYGAYPENLGSLEARHRIPLIFAGGALDGRRGKIPTAGSQTDLAATLLSSLGIEHREFEFSNNLLSRRAPHYAFIVDRNEIGLIDQKLCVSYNIENDKDVNVKDENYQLNIEKLKAYIQKLYDTLARI